KVYYICNLSLFFWTDEAGFPSWSSCKGGWEVLPEGALVLPPALPSSCKTFLICCVISFVPCTRTGFCSLGQDEFLDVIYWFRQIIAVVLGVIWGVLPLRGFLGIAGFCLINAGVLYLYFSNYLQIDEEEYGGTWELTKEGFMTSFALFMVIWIIFYTAIHYD
uniref:RAB5 interacting factor n=1 Tax=Felis catus TaxID=9685 RepID=A0ABI8AEH7_FELCA